MLGHFLPTGVNKAQKFWKCWDCPISGWAFNSALGDCSKMFMPVVAACGQVGSVSKAGSGVNVGFTALVGVKHLPSILLDLQSFFWLLLDSVLHLFVGMVFFEKGGELGLLGYFQTREKGFIMFHLSYMYVSILCTSDGKGLTSVLHGLHMGDCVVWSILKLYIPLRVLTLISTSIVSSGRS